MRVKLPRVSKESKTRMFLLLALFVTGLVIFEDYIRGNHLLVFNDVGGDTWQQYTMHYAGIVNHLRDGNFSFWDFTNGFGFNLFNLNLFDPSLMLLYLLGVLLGPAHMLFYLVWIQIFKILAAGWIFYWFLSEFSYSRQAKLAASYVYGLSGYLLVWGQHYQFGMVTVYFPLMLLFCEKFIRGKKGKGWFPATVFLCGIYSVYFTYMSLIGVGFYLLFRVWMMDAGDWKVRIRKFLAGCGWMLLGVGMSLVIFLPMASILLNVSFRLNSEDKSLVEMLRQWFSLYGSGYYKTLLMRFFSTNFQNLETLGNGVYEGFWTYYEDPVLFCSTLSVIFDVQLLAVFGKSKENKRTKAAVYTAAALIILVLTLQIGGSAFNAFTVPTHRYTFVLIPFFLLAFVWMWDYLREGGKICLVALAVVCAGIVYASLQGYGDSIFQEYRVNAVTLAVTGFVMAGCLLVLRWMKDERRRRIVMGFLAAALVVNVASEGRVTYQDRITLRKEDTPAEDMASQMELYAQEGAVPKSERQARAVFLRPQDYFRELYRQDIQDALQYLKDTDKEFYRVEKNYSSATDALDSQAQGYRGISTYNSVINGNIKEFIDTCYPEMYYKDKNRYAFWQNAEDNWFAAFTGVRYLLSRDENVDGTNYTLKERIGDIYLYENNEEAEMVKFYKNAISEESLKTLCSDKTRETLLNNAIAVEGGEEITSISQLEDTEETRKQSSAFLDAPVNDSNLTGTASIADDGYLLFMIPYEDGWRLAVDGKETELLRGDLGFLACHITEGEHTLTLTFTPPMLKEGAILSLLSWIFYILILLWHSRKSPRPSKAPQ